MLKKTNKKGFTLIELIIVVAIMAVLVALLAPNVIKYLEKSKVGKDINSLDGVRLTVEAEITDEQLYTLSTDDDSTADIEGITLSEIKNAAANSEYYTLSQRLFGENKGIEEVLTTAKAFASKAAKDAVIKVYLNGDGAVAVAAVDANGLVSYDGKDLLVSTKFSTDDLAKLDYTLPAAPQQPADPNA